MISRLPLTVLLLVSVLFCSCSRNPNDETTAENAIPKKISTLKPRSPEAPPEAKPQLLILFEFEGIPQTALDAWLGDRPLRIVQKQIQLDEKGLPILKGDLYIMSPRLINHFIARNIVAPWDPAPDLSSLNPVFTSHPFDMQNAYAVPWRWTPMVLLEHKPDLQSPQPQPQPKTPPAAPSYPDDPAMISMIQSPDLKAPDAPPTLPNPDAYRAVWENFITNKNPSVWIPAACPIRNTSEDTPPVWKWYLPKSQTVIIFDHLLMGATTKHPKEASELLNFLISAEQQNLLVSTSGYFPVLCPLGKETTLSPIPLPKGNWFNYSRYLDLPAYLPPPPPKTEPALPPQPTPTGNSPVPTTSDPAPEPLPTPETVPPVQTAY